MNLLGSNLVAGFAIVFLGGGLGAAFRHGVNLVGLRMMGPDFPYATMFINITGSIVMGSVRPTSHSRATRRNICGCS